jgi:predicted nucleotidyltransferase
MQKNSTLQGYLSILREHMPELRKRYGVRSLGVFGSYVRGEETPRSDLDILVEFAHVPDLFKFMDLEDRLRALLGVKVELVSHKALKGSIGRRILSEVVSL